MSRSGYTDDCWDCDEGSQWRMIRWRGAVKSAIRGKRGQAFLRECLAALDAMPEKRLVPSSFQRADGEVCVLGAVAKHRGRLSSVHAISLYDDDPEYGERDVSEDVAAVLDIPRALAAEIMYENDECGRSTPEARWHWVYGWIEGKLIEWEDGNGEAKEAGAAT